MMQGYEREKALAYMMTHLNYGAHKELGDLIDSLLAQCIDADMTYMHEAGVLDDEGFSGGEWYEEDDAFEFIVDRIAQQNAFTPEQAVSAALLVNEFMDLQAAFMEKAGLASNE